MKATRQFHLDEPLISILLPISKVDQFFNGAIESVFGQSYENIELLLLANGVTDDDFSVIRTTAARDPRVRVFRLELRGLAFALNFGIEMARGVLVARMDGDDVSLPERIRKQVQFMVENPGCDVVGGRVFLIDEGGNRLKRQFRFFENDREIKKVLPYRNPMCHPALIFRKSSLVNVGGYKFGYMSEDHDLFIRMMNNGAVFHNIDCPVLEYRRHSSQITNISKANEHFAEISGFLVINLIKSWNWKYFIGVVAISPPLRRIRNYISGFLAMRRT